ncbi:PDR/VanB family oxidoreductase [Pseudomonas sp. JAI120]|uniref:PDR/VanB family oxidoreductase n=1 Tax=Pseudomonas sp. JAI120 TaxID=2723063 RepID=UPI0030EDE8BB
MIEAIVVSRRLEAEDIFSYELARKDGEPLPSFAAGAHIDVEIRPGLIRQYSLCTPAKHPHRYMIGVLKDPGSRGGSLGMHNNVQEGSTLLISEPRLLFPLERSARRSLLFAGGIGITPILSMAERLAQGSTDFTLHYCARSQSRMAFRERLLDSSFACRTHLHFDDESDEQKLDALKAIGEPEADVHLYVCGPTGFMEHIIETARSLGWDEAHIHREYFSAPQITSPIQDDRFEVTIASTGQVFEIPAGVACVQVLNEAGLNVPVSCEQGVCGTCVVRVLDGMPEHRDLFLTEAEHAKNDQFTPCCSRSKGGSLLLDL